MVPLRFLCDHLHTDFHVDVCFCLSSVMQSWYCWVTSGCCADLLETLLTLLLPTPPSGQSVTCEGSNFSSSSTMPLLFFISVFQRVGYYCLFVVWICISQVTNKVEYLFMRLLAICLWGFSRNVHSYPSSTFKLGGLPAFEL